MRLIVNGAQHDVTAPGHETLLTTLRDRLELTGTKLVCGRGECGACTVLIDGVSAYSCLTLTAACADQVDHDDRRASARRRHAAPACKRRSSSTTRCSAASARPDRSSPAIALLAENPNPTEDDVRRGMSGNLCRCGTYPKILRAVLAAANAGDAND